MKVAIRADSGVGIGAGHVGRCLALADALRRRGHEVLFVSRINQEDFGHMIDARDFALHRILVNNSQDDAAQCRALIRGADWLVVDHYGLAREWEAHARPPGCRLAVIDDLADRNHECDLLIDPGSVDPMRYDGLLGGAPTMLLGPQFAMLRPEFRRAAALDRIGNRNGFLVFFGGGDGQGLTIKTLAALDLIKDRHEAVHVVTTRRGRDREAILARAEQDRSIVVHDDVDDMATLLRNVSGAIGGGGVSMWERCAMSVPSLIIEVAPNQRPGIAVAEMAGAIRSLGPAGTLDATTIARSIEDFVGDQIAQTRMAASGRKLIDGLGVERVEAFLEPLTLRHANAGDARLLWKWANDVDVRANAYTRDSIPWDRHLDWLNGRLQDRACRIYVAEWNDVSIGQVRIEGKSHSAEIDVSLDAHSRGRGLAKIMLIRALAAYQRDFPRTSFEAMVKITNSASRALFESAGFCPVPAQRADSVRYEFAPFPSSISRSS